GLLVGPVPEGGAAVAAVLLEQPHAPVGVAEGDQRLAEQADLDRLAVRLGQLVGLQGRNPVAAEHLAEGRAGPGARQQLVLFSGQHPFSSRLCCVLLSDRARAAALRTRRTTCRASAPGSYCRCSSRVRGSSLARSADSGGRG